MDRVERTELMELEEIDDLDGSGRLAVSVEVPPSATGLFVSVQGSSPLLGMRSRYVARRVAGALGIGIVGVQLLKSEETSDAPHRFDIGLLGRRLVHAVDRVLARFAIPAGIFASGTGAAAALYAAAMRPESICCVVSRGGRPDLAEAILHRVRAPALMVAGGRDLHAVRAAYAALHLLPRSSANGVVLVPGGGTDLSDPEELDAVAAASVDWFSRFMRPRSLLPTRRPTGQTVLPVAVNSRERRACSGGVGERTV